MRLLGSIPIPFPGPQYCSFCPAGGTLVLRLLSESNLFRPRQAYRGAKHTTGGENSSVVLPSCEPGAYSNDRISKMAPGARVMGILQDNQPLSGWI